MKARKTGGPVSKMSSIGTPTTELMYTARESMDRAMQSAESESMTTKRTQPYALVTGPTDPMKRHNKRGMIVPTKMAKEMAKKKKS